MSTMQDAVSAIKSGDKQQGRSILVQILKSEPNNESAWLWMTQAVETTEDKIRCLERVLKINPNNDKARTGLNRLRPSSNNEPDLDDIASIVRQPRERTSSAIRKLSRPAGPSDRQLIEEFVATRTRQGWQVVSQTPTSVQMRKPKQWSTGLLVLGGVLLIFLGIGLLFWLLAVVDYAIKKEQTIYVTAAELRNKPGDKNPGIANNPTHPAIIIAIIVAFFVVFCGLSLVCNSGGSNHGRSFIEPDTNSAIHAATPSLF